MTARIARFGTTADGREVQAVTLAAGELRAVILTHGATLQDLRLAGAPWPLTLGASSVAAYEGPFRYAGAVVGPVANRIAGARAEIDGTLWRFEANEGATCLHGGETGTHARLWEIEAAGTADVTLGLTLPRGLGGFPGARRLTARFAIAAPAALRLDLSAVTDAATLINLANHSYWNLDGAATTAGHRLRIAADRYLPVDDRLIPLAPVPVDGTGFDFRAARPLDPAHPLDHNFCLSDMPAPLRPVAWLDGARGVRLTLATTAPGLQVYDGRGIATAPHPGLTGDPHRPHAGVALEPQVWPDAHGRAGFPSVLLRPGETFRQTTTFTLTRADGG